MGQELGAAPTAAPKRGPKASPRGWDQSQRGHRLVPSLAQLPARVFWRREAHGCCFPAQGPGMRPLPIPGPASPGGTTPVPPGGLGCAIPASKSRGWRPEHPSRTFPSLGRGCCSVGDGSEVTAAGSSPVWGWEFRSSSALNLPQPWEMEGEIREGQG